VTGAARLRVVVAGPADGDPRVAAVARALRDAGAEVVLTGTAAAGPLAATVVQEDADALVVADPPPALPAALAEAGADDVPVVVLGDGGTPPGEVVAVLLGDR
jgi:methylmalonyl-CoA mutase C-terminal domain/subunit